MSESAIWPPPTIPNNSPVLAHFGWRLMGFVADVVSLLLLFIALITMHAVAIATWAPDQVVGLGVVVVAGVTVWARIKWEGAGGSPLRRALGVWIVDAQTHEPIGTRRGFIRAVVRLVSELALYLGYLWMIWDPMRQTWHDKAARSIVVKR